MKVVGNIIEHGLGWFCCIINTVDGGYVAVLAACGIVQVTLQVKVLLPKDNDIEPIWIGDAINTVTDDTVDTGTLGEASRN